MVRRHIKFKTPCKRGASAWWVASARNRVARFAPRAMVPRTARRSAVEFGGDISPPAPQENKFLVGWLGNKTNTPFSSVWVLSAPPCKIDLPFLRPLRRAHHPLGQFTRVLLLVLCRCAVPAFISFGALLATPKRRLSSSSRQSASKTSPPDGR